MKSNPPPKPLDDDERAAAIVEVAMDVLGGVMIELEGARAVVALLEKREREHRENIRVMCEAFGLMPTDWEQW